MRTGFINITDMHIGISSPNSFMARRATIAEPHCIRFLGCEQNRSVLIAHHHPRTSPPPSCLWWWQACLCCRGRSVDWLGWNCGLAAPCGETHSLGPCAPSGLSTDLNNCKMHKGFAQGKDKTSREQVLHIGIRSAADYN